MFWLSHWLMYDILFQCFFFSLALDSNLFHVLNVLKEGLSFQTFFWYFLTQKLYCTLWKWKIRLWRVFACAQVTFYSEVMKIMAARRLNNIFTVVGVTHVRQIVQFHSYLLFIIKKIVLIVISECFYIAHY